jgi:excisionase family DNA binding protein
VPRPDRDAAIARRLLTADEVAALLGVPRSFVYALARRGELPTVRIGERYVRFREEALDRWIAQRETTEAKGTQ